MSSVVRVVVTIMLGWFGIHKLCDKKQKQWLAYILTFGLSGAGWIIDIVSAIQNYKRVSIRTIVITSKILAFIFSMLLLIYFFGSIGTENFYPSSLIFCLGSGIALLKIYVFGNNNCNADYQVKSIRNDVMHRESNTTGIKNDDLPKIRLSMGVESYNDNKNIKIKCLTGKFYDEDKIILDKYRNLKTPNYLLVQINEQLHPSDSVYYLDDMIELSNKYKDKYLDYADFFPFNSYWAQIKDLNEYQLKWYLYWRKEFLNGNVLDTDISYIFIFAYELICYTFNSSAAFNISALDRLYNSYKDLYQKLINYLPQWLDDMLSEVGYYYNLSDMDIKDVEEDPLVNSLTTINELDKININIWRKHYNERKSDLTNKQLSLVYGNQKFNNRLKKYAGLLAKYYIDNKVDVIQKWFEIKVITEKRRLFNSVPCALQRMEGTFKFKKYCSNSSFEHDMNQITKLCYDLVFPQNDMSENEYVVSQYENGKYELPEEFFFMNFKQKENKSSNIIEENEPKTKKEFSIDITKIDTNSTKINFIDNTQNVVKFEKEEQEFIDIFESGLLDKKIAQQYCIKKGKMLNAYINGLNEKYYSALQKKLIIIDDDNLRLNIEKEEKNNE